MVIDRTIIDPGKGHIAGIMLSIIEEEEIMLTEATGPIIELGVDQGNRRNDRFDNRQSYRRGNFRQEHGEQRYRNRSVSQDHDRSRQRFRDSSRSRNQYGRDQSRDRDRRQQSRTVSRDRGNRPRSESRSRSSSNVSTNRDRLRYYRCSEYDHFVRECPNALTEGDSDQEDLDDAISQMLSEDDTLNYAEMEGLNM